MKKSLNRIECEGSLHPSRTKSVDHSPLSLERAARLFRALGDEARLSLLTLISQEEFCVSEIAEHTGEGVSTISQRLRLLRSEGLVKRRREGKHLYYSLVDSHIQNLIFNALEHSEEVSHKNLK